MAIRDITIELKAEEADLLRKLEAVRAMLSAYGEAAQEQNNPPALRLGPSRDGHLSPATSKPQPVRGPVEIDDYTEATRKSVVLSILALYINGCMLKTRDLVAFVESMGHEVNGKNKVNALGALLSRSADVQAHGKSGWTLIDRDKASAIIQKYGPKENEPRSASAGGSDAADMGAPTPSSAWNKPHLSPAS
ncbi:hypothetical protein I5E68_05380 [Novosphingobium sp. YJ-S2-02]|uniref:Uncharacterized protein n=1 Tax=Novosphingobium aureum TaxID=2792964 RepID=A0A931HBG1_9SPHN|nr:hypothetical protein [Novosphingobium aureum]MBH0112386.1 hypothetical protein [Novosphingobium aureum]